MRSHTLISVPLVATLALGLSGCIANPVEQLVSGGVEEIVEQVTGTEVDVPVDGVASVPADFPSELPLPPQAPFSALAIEDTWVLSYAPAEFSDVDPLVLWYLTNGYEETGTMDMGELRIWQYQNETYAISLSLTLSDESVLQYSVTLRE